MIKNIVIKEAKTQEELHAFVKFPFTLYKDNPYWVPPLIKDEIETIDPNLNPVYQNADARLFLAYYKEKVVGRIAAIVNWIEVNEIKKSKVRFGWFDTIDNIEVTKLLIDKVIEFGQKHNLKSIEGPLGFSNLDKAGLLIEGFKERNTLITLYNYPYYSEHLKKLGFNEAARWVEYEIKIDDFESSPEKVKRFSKLIMERYNLTLLNFKNRSEILPYVDQMFDLLDKTYNSLQTYIPIQDYQIENYKKRFLKFVNPDFIKCIIDNEGKLICFSITMPSFTKALKKY
ncbi:MAG: GTP cyclohydrolase [Flavobacteriaceae bacterium]